VGGEEQTAGVEDRDTPRDSESIDIETKAKRIFDPPKFSISKRSKQIYSKILRSKSNEQAYFKKFLEQRENESPCS
jgi:hypothetical protein